MTREIKFRAWVPQFESYGEVLNISFSEEGLPEIIEVFIDGSNHHLNAFEVILEQYTGLKDKNSKEICVGDIVEIGKYGKYQIIWHEWACKFDFSKIGKREREEPLLSQDWEQETEIISNIHENSELLKGEEE